MEYNEGSIERCINMLLFVGGAFDLQSPFFKAVLSCSSDIYLFQVHFDTINFG